jgi:hypothetical protein
MYTQRRVNRILRIKLLWAMDHVSLIADICTAITESDYQRRFRQWQERCNNCIEAQAHYFEGD